IFATLHFLSSGSYQKKMGQDLFSCLRELYKYKARFKNQFYFKNFYERNKKKSLFHKLNRQRYFVTLVNRSNHFKLLKCFKMFLAYWILISSESLGHLPY
ncbi:hypothetical protein ALC56_04840, partial [Trachymyrmex septentrionalis]